MQSDRLDGPAISSGQSAAAAGRHIKCRLDSTIGSQRANQPHGTAGRGGAERANTSAKTMIHVPGWQQGQDSVAGDMNSSRQEQLGAVRHYNNASPQPETDATCSTSDSPGATRGDVPPNPVRAVEVDARQGPVGQAGPTCVGCGGGPEGGVAAPCGEGAGSVEGHAPASSPAGSPSPSPPASRRQQICPREPPGPSPAPSPGPASGHARSGGTEGGAPSCHISAGDDAPTSGSRCQSGQDGRQARGVVRGVQRECDRLNAIEAKLGAAIQEHFDLYLRLIGITVKMGRSVEETRRLYGRHLRDQGIDGVHGDSTPPWEIIKSPLGGRGVVATRDLLPGDLVLVDAPLVLGPRAGCDGAPPVCVGCHRPRPTSELRACPRGCRLPVCARGHHPTDQG